VEQSKPNFQRQAGDHHAAEKHLGAFEPFNRTV